MQQTAPPSPARESAETAVAELAESAIVTARRWLDESRGIPVDRSVARLATLLADPDGLDFAIAFVEGVIRPEDQKVAASEFERLARGVPKSVPFLLRIMLQVGGAFSSLFPGLILPIVNRVFRRLVGHMVLDANPETLGDELAALRKAGMRLNVNLLGEAILGGAEADRRLAGVGELVDRHDVDYVSIKLSGIATAPSLWDYEGTVERLVERLLPLYQRAAASAAPTFINLDMEEFHDLVLTADVFTRLLDRPELLNLHAGIVLQAYLPDALPAYRGLAEWAAARRERGGAPIKVRLVKGANLAMERVDAELNGRPLATWSSKEETDAHYKRILDWAMTPQRLDAVRLGVAGHNLFDAALAWELARARGVENRIEFEMLLGMVPAQAEVVRRHVSGLRLYTPVVPAAEFTSAIAYLVRRLEENAGGDNFMSAAHRIAHDKALFDREAGRFRRSLERVGERVPPTMRRQNRLTPPAIGDSTASGFVPAQTTDPALTPNQQWIRQIAARAARSTAGADTVAQSTVTDAAALDAAIADAARAGGAWGGKPAAQRAELVREGALVFAAFRGRFVEVLASEVATTVREADAEASRAVDLAEFFAERAPELDGLDGARHVPDTVTVVAPSAAQPVADTAASVCAALAAGSAVIVAPDRRARRSAALVVDALREAGAPEGLVRLVVAGDGELAKKLIAHGDVDRVMFSGDAESAALLRGWRPERPPLSDASRVSSIVVTPSADIGRAVADLVESAFARAGQHPSAARLAILVGSVAETDGLTRRLADAVSSLSAAPATEPRAVVGPLLEPARGRALAALGPAAAGERWLVAPRQLDDSGALWSAGVRECADERAAAQRSMHHIPVLNLVAVDTLDEAIALQNAARGLVAGIHSHDVLEIAEWIDAVEAATLAVNRPTVGHVVGRDSLGGWVGTSPRADGRDTLLGLGRWQPVFAQEQSSVRLDGVSAPVQKLIEAAQPSMQFVEFDLVRTGALSDEAAWQQHYGAAIDPAGLRARRSILRYLPAAVTVRLSEGASPAQLIRVLAAAARARARITISSAVPVPTELVRLFGAPASPLRVDSVTVESDVRWRARLTAGQVTTTRIRLIGGDAAADNAVLVSAPHIAVFAGDVTTSGRLELLPFVREQSISITAHRHGHADPELALLEF